jgi:hypothetical protein
VNNSSSGGYVQPRPQPPTLVSTPPNLNFVDFMQSILVGLSGAPGNLVRSDWQQKPPKRPDVDVNWIAFGIEGVNPDFNTYIGQNSSGQQYMQQNELFGLVVNFYGPLSYENYGLVRDNFQVPQNLANLTKANVGYGYDTPAQHVPELIDEIWFDRWRVVFYLRRQIQRFYPLLTFVSASGTIYANDQGTKTTEVPIVVEE